MIIHYPLLPARLHDIHDLNDLLDGFEGVAPADKGFTDGWSGISLKKSHMGNS